jgi:GNAT superfamily N-acetyltransferase
VTIRVATPEDISAMAVVRTSVVENHLSIEGMAARGITLAGVAADLASGRLGGWVAEEDGRIVAFSMANRDDGQIFALFTLPGYERRGHGNRLLDEAVAFLRRHGHGVARLSTGRGSTAQRFYERRGWRLVGDNPDDIEDVLLRKDI